MTINKACGFGIPYFQTNPYYANIQTCSCWILPALSDGHGWHRGTGLIFLNKTLWPFVPIPTHPTPSLDWFPRKKITTKCFYPWTIVKSSENPKKPHPGSRVRGELAREPVVTMDALYARESGHGAGSDRLHELKIKMAVEAYESRPLEIWEILGLKMGKRWNRLSFRACKAIYFAFYGKNTWDLET